MAAIAGGGRLCSSGSASSSSPSSLARHRPRALSNPARSVAQAHATNHHDGDQPSACAPSTSGSDSGGPPGTRRRGALLSLVATGAAAALAVAPVPPPAHAAKRSPADMKAVGSYLPPAPAGSMSLPDGYVLYEPDARTTPATRAGVIKAPFYRFGLAPSLVQQPLVNALTGGFCFPGCEEPWYEAAFADPAVGKVFLCCIFLRKLLPSARDDGGGATVETLGAADGVARAVGPLITGQGYEDEDLLSASTRRTDDGQVFYDLELLASTADPAGPHRLAAATVKGGIVYLFVGAATDRQWSKGGEQALRAMVKSFRA